MRSTVSGVGVLDKSMSILEAVTVGATTMQEVIAATGIAKPTAHRLAAALEAHGLLRRSASGLALGIRFVALGQLAGQSWPVADAARPALEWLRDVTGESVQLYVASGGERLCIASLESPQELRTTVPLGALLPLERGSAGRLLVGGAGAVGRQGWVESVEERASGVASVSAPAAVLGDLVAVSVSGPIERTTRRPGAKYGAQVVEAAQRIEGLLEGAGGRNRPRRSE